MTHCKRRRTGNHHQFWTAHVDTPQPYRCSWCDRQSEGRAYALVTASCGMRNPVDPELRPSSNSSRLASATLRQGCENRTGCGLFPCELAGRDKRR